MSVDLLKPLSSYSNSLSEIELQDLALPELGNDPPAQKEASSTSAPRSSLWADVKYGGFAVLMWLFAVAFCWLTAIPRLVSYLNHKSLRDGLEQKQIEKLAEALNTVIEGERLGEVAQFKTPGRIIANFSEAELTENIVKLEGEKVDPKAAAELAKKTVKIMEKVYQIKNKGSSLFLDVEKIKSLLAETMNLPLYRELARSRACHSVNFLQCLAVKLISADGNDLLRGYGKEWLGKKTFEEGRSLGPTELADALSGALGGISFRTDHAPQWAFWALAHPQRAIHSCCSKTHPIEYDSTYSNPYIAGHRFEDGDKRIQFYYGPGPTGSPLYEWGVLPALEKCQTFDLRFNHQNTHDPKDHARIEETLRMESDQHLHAVISFEKKWAASLCKEFTSAQDFFTKYREKALEGIREIEHRKVDNGYVIPEDLLSDEAVLAAFDKAEEFCRNLSENNAHWKQAMESKKGRKRMGKMMMLVADTFLTLGMLYGSFDRITPEMAANALNQKLDKDLWAIRTSGACKQNVDRAVVENISLRLFFRWASDPSPLREEEACEIAGAVLGRARLVDDRRLLMRRYQVLDDLLRFVGGCENGGGLLLAYGSLSGYRNAFSSEMSPRRQLSSGSFRIPGLSTISAPVHWFKKQIFG